MSGRKFIDLNSVFCYYVYMAFKLRESKIRTIKQNDPLFTISDGLMMANRAGFEVSNGCPYEYRLIISECIDRGWLKPVAYMTAEEQLIETLKQ